MFSSMPLVSIDDLSIGFRGPSLLDGVSATIEAGQRIGLLGRNGAGKTTASFTILPEIIECKEFVNADEIAKGLSPFQPEKVAFEAGRIMIERINELLKENASFAFETTLSTRSYRNKIVRAKK